MTEADLDAVIARTKHERYRWLTSDENLDADEREGYRLIVRNLASSPPLSPLESGASPPADPHPSRDWTAWRRVVRVGALGCFYATREPGCGCSGFKCHHLGRLATAADCLECLAAVPPAAPDQA